MAIRLLSSTVVLRRCFSLSSVAFKEPTEPKEKSVAVRTTTSTKPSVPGLRKDNNSILGEERDDESRRMLLRTTAIEINEPLDNRSISGVPEEHMFTRRVRVFKPAKNAMQSGSANIQCWMIEMENRERWENPLMGWGSTGDPLSNIDGWLRFDSKEDAMKFCEKNNWTYFVDEPEVVKRPIKKSYADNFSWNKRTRVGSK